jgi:uncharacterized metal-binding protein YceD (DUF177 family)
MADQMLRFSDLTRAVSVNLQPDATARQKIAQNLGILGVRKLRFSGSLAPDGARDWTLVADLGATVQQSCVVTLEPVTTRIDAKVVRRYLAEMPSQPEGDEVEIPDDDSAEPLPVSLDLVAVMTEALALELPDWPRAEGVEVVDVTLTEPGRAPITDADAKPFASLKSLRDKLSDDGESTA